MIVEENINGWNSKPVKTDDVIYPQSKDDKAPKNYFLGIFCGSRGSGVVYICRPTALKSFISATASKKISTPYSHI